MLFDNCDDAGNIRIHNSKPRGSDFMYVRPSRIKSEINLLFEFVIRTKSELDQLDEIDRIIGTIKLAGLFFDLAKLSFAGLWVFKFSILILKNLLVFNIK